MLILALAVAALTGTTTLSLLLFHIVDCSDIVNCSNFWSYIGCVWAMGKVGGEEKGIGSHPNG